jgi:hypothetical protein
LKQSQGLKGHFKRRKDETPGRVSLGRRGGIVRAGREDKIEQAKETFEDALNKVLPVAKTVVDKVQGMASKPDEIEVTFGVTLSTMAGAVIASASAAANFGVTIHWTRTHAETTS